MTIVAPARFWTWLCDYSGVEDIGLERLDFVCCHDLRISLDSSLGGAYANAERFLGISGKVERLVSELGLVDIKTCSVVHCPWAYGLSLTHSSGWKLVYSGDTRPCASLVALGRAGQQPPTILLHEATHSDDLLEDAKAKRHTTVSEAVAMALGMANGPGTMANGAAVSDSASAMDTAEEEEPEEVAEKLATLDDVSAAKKELMLELAESLSESSAVSDCEQQRGLLGDLKVASAVDLSAYAPSDIARYRANTHRLQKALRAELQLFIAEQESSSDDEDEASKQSENKPAKSKGPKPKHKTM
ncbi:hypothetical protein GGI04_005346 [Coemansia thaxteri]|nr:hypothetical protein GGI04_005346 [Coemansia thaxteri]